MPLNETSGEWTTEVNNNGSRPSVFKKMCFSKLSLIIYQNTKK